MVLERVYERYVAKDERSQYQGGPTRRWLNVKQKDWAVAEDRAAICRILHGHDPQISKVPGVDNTVRKFAVSRGATCGEVGGGAGCAGALRLAGQRAGAGERDPPAVVLAARPVVHLEDVPLDVAMPETVSLMSRDTLPLREACDEFEWQYVLRTLERSRWNVSRRRKVYTEKRGDFAELLDRCWMRGLVTIAALRTKAPEVLKLPGPFATL